MKVIDGKLNGWCQVGSVVTTDFYTAQSTMKRRVEKIHIWPNTRVGGEAQAKVWLSNGHAAQLEVDFDTWVKRPVEEI